jgi:ABC-type uncharacterized transport system permease subunit
MSRALFVAAEEVAVAVAQEVLEDKEKTLVFVDNIVIHTIRKAVVVTVPKALVDIVTVLVNVAQITAIKILTTAIAIAL